MKPVSQKIYLERRQSERLPHRGGGTLITSESSWTAHIINISLQGALIALLEPHNINEDQTITLQISLSDGNSILTHGHVAHVKDHYIGLECQPNTEQDARRLREVIREIEENL